MHADNDTHISHIVLNRFEKASKGAQSFRSLNELFAEGTISKSPCGERFARLRSGGTSLEDKPGRGQLTDFDDQALSTTVEGHESLRTRMLIDNFNGHHSTIVCRLKKLGF